LVDVADQSNIRSDAIARCSIGRDASICLDSGRSRGIARSAGGLPISIARIATVLTGGFVCGLLAVVLAIGNGSLLARGELSGYLSTMIAVALFSAGFMPVATAFLSTIRGQVTATQEMPVVALVGVAGAAAAGFSGPAHGPAFLATVLVAIGLTTTLSGLGMFLLGQASRGRIIRFVPYPVFGGFLAITGWYLLQGGFEIVVGTPGTLALLPRLAEPAVALKVLLALAFVTLLQLSETRLKSAMLLPMAVIATIAAFNLTVWAAALPVADLQRAGWIIPVPEQGGVWPPVSLADLGHIDWHAVLGAMLFAPIVMLATAAAAIMNVSGIELEIEGDVNLDRELRSMGTGNVLSGLVGGIPGFPSVSGTLLAVKLGAAERVTGLVVGGIAFLAVTFAPQLISLMPAPVLGALLMWLGVTLLIEWVLKPVRTLQKGEYAIILVILAVSILAGFPAGILTGLVAALGLFVVEYSRVATARFITDGRDYQGELMPDAHREVLEEHGTSIVIIKLSGFVFFGTCDRLAQQVEQRVAAHASDKVSVVIMDFRRVTGIDSSAVMSFSRLRRFAAGQGFVVVLSGLDPAIRNRLVVGGLDLDDDGVIHVEAEIDDALRWAAGRLLVTVAPELTAVAPPGAGHAVARILGEDELAGAMYPYLDHVEFPAGARVIEQGAISEDIYFVEEGEGIVQLEPKDGAPVKLAAFGSGTIIGEIAFYRGEPRSASVIARTPIVASRLSHAALSRIDAEVPALAARFHQEMARALAGRLQGANRLIHVLAD
jgi:sulfate permease, SulP family